MAKPIKSKRPKTTVVSTPIKTLSTDNKLANKHNSNKVSIKIDNPSDLKAKQLKLTKELQECFYRNDVDRFNSITNELNQLTDAYEAAIKSKDKAIKSKDKTIKSKDQLLRSTKKKLEYKEEVITATKKLQEQLLKIK